LNETTTDPSIVEYLKNHGLGILATVNRNGTPQQTLIGYRWDGQNVVISATADRLKVKNASKRPAVSMAVVDERDQVIVYGKAWIERDPARVLDLHRAHHLQGAQQVPDKEQEFAEQLIREGRVVMVITPERFYPERLRRRA
jgi:PPOX class probable F420-dependent enzyme